jgi:hypothetical protein
MFIQNGQQKIEIRVALENGTSLKTCGVVLIMLTATMRFCRNPNKQRCLWWYKPCHHFFILISKIELCHEYFAFSSENQFLN